MPRRIVLVGKGESLDRAWRSRSFGHAGADLERLLHVPGFALDDTYHPVHVAVVDTGIDGSRIPVAGGWAPGSDYVPGSAKADHGTMVAYDVRIAAPEAKIYDYALLRTEAGTWAAFLSDAIAAFADLIEQENPHPGRWVLDDRWELCDRCD